MEREGRLAGCSLERSLRCEVARRSSAVHRAVRRLHLFDMKVQTFAVAASSRQINASLSHSLPSLLLAPASPRFSCQTLKFRKDRCLLQLANVDAAVPLYPAMASALILVDVQHDFLPPSGSLAVTGGLEILPVCLDLLNSHSWAAIIASQDYHPQGHM